MFQDRSVCVTGAGGSIGSELCRQIAAAGARRLVLVSLTEGGLYNIDRELRRLAPDLELVPVLGSVEDFALMQRVLAGSEIVIHAAAHKHLPICETNPCAAIRNNALGTHELLRAASLCGVREFLLISTDKAVKPTSVMGASKRLAEIIVRNHPDTTMQRVVVRFGNVLDSAGSVLPLWREQIARGGPITLTDERCERYFMSIPDAVYLVGTVLDTDRDGTFVFDMGKPRRLVDMARELMREVGEVEIRMTGLRPGEKLTEELHYGGELEQVAPKVFRVRDMLPTVRDDQLNELEWLAGCGMAHEAKQLLWQLICPVEIAKVA